VLTDLFTMRASVRGFSVFLDYFAIKDLAKGDPAREETLHSDVGP
jgi:hypothetical protein